MFDDGLDGEVVALARCGADEQALARRVFSEATGFGRSFADGERGRQRIRQRATGGQAARKKALGVFRLRDRGRATKHGLPRPKYEFDGVYLNLTIYRTLEAAVTKLTPSILVKLSKSECKGWKWLATQYQVTSYAYASALGIPYRTAVNHLRKFQELGLLEKIGSARATEYRIRKP